MKPILQVFIIFISFLILQIDAFFIHTENQNEPDFDNFDGITTPENEPSVKRVKKSVATHDRSQLWKMGIIPYEIESYFNGSQLRIIKLGMQIWEEATCIKFVKRNPEFHPNYVAITKLDCGCCYIEKTHRNKGRSELSLNDGCHELTIVLHELGHVLGFYHEHEHPDRDQYIQIVRGNIARGYRQEFGKFSPSEVDTLKLPYDYQSVMHYPTNAFAKLDIFDTIIPLQPTNARLGNKIKLSTGDRTAANRLYQCPKCGGYLTGTVGKIKLPAENDGHCEWRIRAAYGERISVIIEFLNFHTNLDCTDEYLEIQAGHDNLNNDLADRICTKKQNSKKLLSKDMILSYFKTTNKNTSSEFEATYEKHCDSEIELPIDDSIYLESPNYPHNYQRNKSCWWKINAPEDHVVEIQFDFFSLEDSIDCANDYVKIIDGYNKNSPVIGVYCGARNPWKFISWEKSVNFQFISNNFIEDAGFSATIRAVHKIMKNS